MVDPAGASPPVTSTIYAVIVCIDFVITNVKFFELPLAIVTIIVSPKDREIPNTKEAIIPDNAAGITTRFVTSNFVDPIAKAPSLNELGTELIASSEREATMGIIIIPITNPGLSILVGSKLGINSLNIGAINVKAKKPYTIVGIPASTSKSGLTNFLTRFDAYSLKNMAVINPIGIATIIAIIDDNIVPVSNGSKPNSGF